MASLPDALVIGGGAIGLGIAWRASLLGSRVTVVDPSPGEGASWAAAGMLAPVTEAHFGEEALIRLNLAAAAAYPSFVEALEEETGLSCGYRRCGTLAVALDADDARALDDLAAFQRSLGLLVEGLSGRDCRSLEPMLAPGVWSGLHVPSDHQVDNRRLVRALLAAVVKRAAVLRGRAVEILVAGDRATGVRLDDGPTLRAPTVVLAAGCWSASIRGLPEPVRPPVRPVKGQILRLRVPVERPLAGRTVRWLAQGSAGYLVPRADGELVLGATVEERGFDTQVTAGAVHELLRDASRVLPGVAEAGFEECRAGLRPGSPDNAPIVGTTPVEGLLLATGHHRNGILLTPVTASGIAAQIATGQPDPLLAPFGLSRFAAAMAPAPA
jgi:glycine oxidase